MAFQLRHLRGCNLHRESTSCSMLFTPAMVSHPNLKNYNSKTGFLGTTMPIQSVSLKTSQELRHLHTCNQHSCATKVCSIGLVSFNWDNCQNPNSFFDKTDTWHTNAGSLPDLSWFQVYTCQHQLQVTSLILIQWLSKAVLFC